MNKPLRLGTRGSQLALWQARYVASRLEPIVAPRPVELVIIETDGDRVQDKPLSAMGGFGVFTKAIQEALLDNRADVAVHSLKDLPTMPVPNLILTATPPRGPFGDAFVSLKYQNIDEVPNGATLATSSLRRKAQLLNQRPDLQIVDLRGNVETRLRKLEENDWAGIILAEAGLVRLGLGHRISSILNPTWMLPAVGQGAIGLECRADDHETRHLVEGVSDSATMARVLAERSMLYALGGGCLVPIGTYSHIQGDELHLRGSVLSPDGRRKIVASHFGKVTEPIGIGQELAAQLLAEGAGEILELHAIREE